MVDKIKLEELIKEVWSDFDTLKEQEEVHKLLVPEAMPLLWFGNLPAYEQSALKILTVSKNPSYAEFGENHRFEEGLPYQESLNQYFQYNPSSWFNNLDKLLKYFDGGYRGAINTALHADLFTPIATHPVWPGLTKEEQKYFPMRFAQLIEILKPELILTSLSAKNLKIMVNQFEEETIKIFHEEEPGKSAKYIQAYRINENLLLINGRNFQGTYFGGMSSEFITHCFQEIRKVV